MFNSRFFKIYLLPGITFQSLVISGGYCTGQEIVQYFLSSGPAEGFWGLIATTIIWSILCAITFIFAKAYHAYDYKSFFSALLGRGWFLYEICYLYIILLVLSIIGASVGSMLQIQLGIPYSVGLILPFLYILLMVFKGNKHIEKMFSYLSVALYAVFIAFLVFCYQRSTNTATVEAFSFPHNLSWIKKGFIYATYNLCCIPAVLFSLKYIQTKKQAMISGLLAGPITSIPAIMLFFALLTEYPHILNAVVPSSHMLEKLGIPLLTVTYSLVLISTLVETGVGVTYALSDRMALKKYQTALVLGVLFLAFILSQFGLVNLIVKGYGLLTWLIFGVFIVPLLSIGLFKIFRHTRDTQALSSP